jgi:hypothetical protein
MATDGPDWQRITTEKAPPFHVYTKPLQKSENDDREYRVIQLKNGLQATLVHDAKADKAAASLDVAVGHLYDPVRPFSLPCRVYARLWSDGINYGVKRLICRVWHIFVNIYCSW